MIATHTPSTYVSIVRDTLERERTMRIRHLKGDAQRKALEAA